MPKPTRRVWPWLVSIFLLGTVLNTFTHDFALAHGNRGIYVVGILPVLLAMAGAWCMGRRGMKRTAFMLIPLLLLLVFVEVGFRIYSHVATPQVRAFLATPVAGETGGSGVYSPHHYMLYQLTPDASFSDGLRHNSLGLRDEREFVFDPNAIRIVFIGGSTTYTIGIRDNKAIFTSGLEDRLNKHFAAQLGDRRIEVVNAGMGGSTSAENLLRLQFFVSEIDPDLVVIQHGLNDVWVRGVGEIQTDFANYRRAWAPPPLFHPDYSIAFNLHRRVLEYSMFLNLCATRLGLYRARLLRDYTTHVTRETPKPDMLSQNDTRYFERNTRYMIALSRTMGARVMLATIPITERAKAIREIAVPEHNAVLKRLAQETGCFFYDFAADMPKDDTHLPDGRHVSQQGSDAKRDLYFEHFVESGIVADLLAPSRSSSR